MSPQDQSVLARQEQNERMTRVGAGTPGGAMLRRYWWPVGVAAHLAARPTFVRLLGEDLVLFRDGAGRIGLIGAQCSHRRANLCLGTIEGDGLRCRYHGWKYGIDGSILEIPGVTHQHEIARDIHHLAYPAIEHGGLILAYLGPRPAPLPPQYDFLAAPGDRIAEITGFSDANWLQCVENGMDPFHVAFLHGDVIPDLGAKPVRMDYVETEHGMYHATYRPGPRPGTYFYREHHLVMPGISITGAGQRRIEGGEGPPAVSARWTVPIDDVRTLMVNVFFKPAANTGRIKDDPNAGGFGGWEAVKIEPFKEYLSGSPREVGYTMPRVVPSQDATVLDSMGPICDREHENLVPGDEAIVRLRRIYSNAIADVEAGREPQGVFRKPGIAPVPASERVIAAETAPA